MQRQNVTLNDTLEDLFGLSFRALSTLKTVFVRPTEYYVAAMSKDWSGRFTPSIRLWLSIFALLSLLQFIWLRDDSPLVLATASSISEGGIPLPTEMTADQLSQQIYVTIYTVYPFLALIAFVIGGAIFPFWGVNHTAATRIRLTFVTLIPGAVVSLLSLILVISFLPDQLLYLAASFPLILALITPATEWLFTFTTSARGAFPDSTIAFRVLRALALASWLGVVNLAATSVSQFVASLVVQFQTGVPLVFDGS